MSWTVMGEFLTDVQRVLWKKQVSRRLEVKNKEQQEFLRDMTQGKTVCITDFNNQNQLNTITA